MRVTIAAAVLAALVSFPTPKGTIAAVALAALLSFPAPEVTARAEDNRSARWIGLPDVTPVLLASRFDPEEGPETARLLETAAASSTKGANFVTHWRVDVDMFDVQIRRQLDPPYDSETVLVRCVEQVGGDASGECHAPAPAR